MECEQIWSRQTHKSTIRGDHKQPSQKAAIEIALENLRILTAMVAVCSQRSCSVSTRYQQTVQTTLVKKQLTVATKHQPKAFMNVILLTQSQRQYRHL